MRQPQNEHKNGKQHTSDKHVAIALALFGAIGMISYFISPEAFIPAWAVVALFLLIFSGAIGYAIPKKYRYVSTPILRRVGIVSLVVFLSGVGFYGTGECSVSGAGIRNVHGSASIVCTLPGYVGVVIGAAYLLSEVKKIKAMLENKR